MAPRSLGSRRMRRIARAASGLAFALGVAAPTARADGDTIEGHQRDLGLGMRAAEPAGLWWDAFA